MVSQCQEGFFVGKVALVIVTFVHLLNVFFVASMGIGHVHGAMPGWGGVAGTMQVGH